MKESLENAKFLGITIKNVKEFEGHDTLPGFNATVYIDGKRAFHALEPATGGPMEYRPCDNKMKGFELSDLIQELEDKLKTRPKYEFKLGKQKYTNRDNLDIVITALVEDLGWQKLINRNKSKGILVELEENRNFTTIKYKAGTITAMLKKYEKRAVVMMLQGTVTRELKNGKTILNKEYLEQLGVKFK
jgi:hypothetical protein